MSLCSIRSKKGVAGVVALTALVTFAMTFGIFALTNPSLLSMWTDTGATPTIDGVVSTADNWDRAQYIHSQYFVPYNLSEFISLLGSNGSEILYSLVTGKDLFKNLGYSYNGTNFSLGNNIAYNWFHFQVGSDALYILADMCFQTKPDASGEWMWLAIDNAGNQSVISPFIDISTPTPSYNTSVLGNTLNWLFVNASATNPCVKNLGLFGVPEIDGWLNATITDATVKVGFGATMHSTAPHRFYEISIPLLDLSYDIAGSAHPFNEKLFGVGMWGGSFPQPFTAAPPNYIWFAPSLNLPVMPSSFFLCGTSVDGWATVPSFK